MNTSTVARGIICNLC